MPIFPTQYSTLSAVALNTALQTAYGLTKTTCRLLIRNVSDTYILEGATQKYIFKIYRDSHRRLEEIKGEVELLNVLAQNGASVSFPIADMQGQYIQVFNAAEGTRYGVLFTWALGKVIYNMDNEQLAQVGTQMATVHNITSVINLQHPRKVYNTETTLIQPLLLIKPAFADGLEAEYDWLSQSALQVNAHLQQLNPQNFSYGYCHYDFLPKNFHFTPDNQLTFFDFDFAGKGYLVNDVMSFYIHFFMEATSQKITKQTAMLQFNTFVESYQRVKPISDNELKAIPYLGFAFWVFYLGFQYQNFDDWSNIFFTPKFIADRVALIKKWLAWFGE